MSISGQKNENWALKVADGIREVSSPLLVQSASWPVHEMSSPWVSNLRVGVSASCPVTPEIWFYMVPLFLTFWLKCEIEKAGNTR